MGTTEPTSSTRAWLRLRDAKNADLRRFVRARGGRLRKHLHSEAAERGAIAPLGHDELRQEVTAVTALLPAVAEAINPSDAAFFARGEGR